MNLMLRKLTKNHQIDFLIRIISIGLKTLSLLIILKFDKNLLPVIFFFSTFGGFIFKLSSLSELNNYRRITNEANFINIGYLYFINCLFRTLIFLLIFNIIFFKLNLNFDLKAIFLFSITTFIINYLAAWFIINSNQVKTSLINIIGSAALLVSIIISDFLSGDLLNNICFLYFIITSVIFFLIYLLLEKKYIILRYDLNKILKFIIFKNFNIRYFSQIKRAFFGLTNYSILAVISFLISEYSVLSINIKNTLIIFIYISNLIVLYLCTSYVFPNVVLISKGNYVFKYYNHFNKIVLFLVIIFLLFLNFVRFADITLLIFSVLIYGILTFLLSIQDFYIQARSVSYGYILIFLILFFFNFTFLYYIYSNSIFIPLLLVLPKLSMYLLNYYYFRFLK